jgi:hypothetical protein
MLHIKIVLGTFIVTGLAILAGAASMGYIG